MAAYDVVGNICIVKFSREVKANEKKQWAEKFMKQRPSVRTVVEKVGKFSGRLRVPKTRWIAGEKTKEVLYKENNCIFRFNIDTCYFSPRLASERKKIAEKVKKGEDVLVMFGGVAPYAIIIAKSSNPCKVVSVEIGRECSKYAADNVKRNKVDDKVEVVQGDVRKIIGKGKKLNKKFDRVIMPRPNLKDSFLDIGFKSVKKGGVVHYYGFYEEKNKGKMIELIYKKAKECKRKVKILFVKEAGEIGLHKYRYRADIKILN